MKSQIKYLSILIIAALCLECNNPQPTSLVEDEDPLEIEVINRNPTDPTYFGVDTIGASGDLTRFSNIVSVTVAKGVLKSTPFRSSFAQAVFFDKSKPVFINNGKLVGFKTVTPGSIFFNNRKAQVREFIIKYGINKDTLLGSRYVLHRRGNLGDPFDIEFNSSVSFSFIPDSAALNSISFDIETPREIFLTSRLAGTKSNRNLNLLLEWNSAFVKNFEITVGVLDSLNIIPLYKIKTADDGKFKMPQKLLEELSLRFDTLYFTLTRKFEKRQSNGVVEFLVLSQSLNSISVGIP